MSSETIIKQLIDNARPDSVSVSKNSRGYSWEVKLYGDAGSVDGAATLYGRIKAFTEMLNKAFPQDAKEQDKEVNKND